MKAIKKIIDKTSDVLSFPARRKARNMIRRDSKLVEDMKMVRGAKGSEPVKNDHTDPLFRVRANVINAKIDREEKNKKDAKKKAKKPSKKVQEAANKAYNEARKSTKGQVATRRVSVSIAREAAYKAKTGRNPVQYVTPRGQEPLTRKTVRKANRISNKAARGASKNYRQEKRRGRRGTSDGGMVN